MHIISKHLIMLALLLAVGQARPNELQVVLYDASLHADGIRQILGQKGLNDRTLEYWVGRTDHIIRSLDKESHIADRYHITPYFGHVLVESSQSSRSIKQTVLGFMVSCTSQNRCNSENTDSTYWYIEWLGLDAAWRGKGKTTQSSCQKRSQPGVAHLLYQQAESDARLQKLPIMLNTRVENISMQNFCQKIGMKEVFRNKVLVYYTSAHHLTAKSVTITSTQQVSASPIKRTQIQESSWRLQATNQQLIAGGVFISIILLAYYGYKYQDVLQEKITHWVSSKKSYKKGHKHSPSATMVTVN